MKIVISSGHGKHIRGASGILDEVDEARRVVNRVAEYLAAAGVAVEVFHDDTSTTQDANLERIVNFHNAQTRELDVSVHFNAYLPTENPMGCEVLYVTQAALAGNVSDRICNASSLKNRGAKKRSDLYFLNNTEEPAILIETCFVDSDRDADLYRMHFDGICRAIAETISGVMSIEPPTTETPPVESGLPWNWAKLVTIEPVTIWQMFGGGYVSFVSDLDICNDGSGPAHGDPHHCEETAYWNNGKFLNADVDKYIVIPPQVRELIPHKVMGCQGRLTDLKTGIWNAGVCGEIGPDDKTGEAAYCLAKAVNTAVDYNAGDKSMHYLFELWPAIPATVDGTTYKLE
jgi:hypothetical protein